MVIRMLICAVGLAACAPAPEPLPPVQLPGAAGNTSFGGNAREVLDRVSANQHSHLIQ